MSELRKTKRNFDLSKDKKVEIDLDGLIIRTAKGDTLFLSHRELRSLNKIRKRYNHDFKTELLFARGEV